MNNRSEITMISQVHLAAQYLAAAGISFLEKEQDDSHTNLAFDVEEGSLYSRPLNEQEDQLVFDYERFSLEWKSGIKAASFSLDGAQHSVIVAWIRNMASQSGINKIYRYEFHYDLSYSIDEEYTFKLNDAKALKEMKALRALAHLSIEEFLKRQGLEAEIRIWPHHFDTGAYFVWDEARKLAIGLGLAIPDALCDEFYFYISGYSNNTGIDPKNFDPLNIGEWISDGFKGAILPRSKAKENSIHDFFSTAFTVLSALDRDTSSC